MTDGTSFYDEYVTREANLEEDRLWRVLRHVPDVEGTFLDVGCASGRNLRFLAAHRARYRFHGIDIAEQTPQLLGTYGFTGLQADASAHIPFPDCTFDALLCGEVIEHVVDTDNLVAELLRVLKPGGRAIVTTPNLAYIPNRVLLLLGLQPLFTETSLKQNLGRGFHFLGQGNATQGHLKIFTLNALLELLKEGHFNVEAVEGYRHLEKGWVGALDAMFARRASFAAGFVICATRPAS